MNAPYFILALPRSRTAWCAAFLSSGYHVCYHDALARVASVAELKNLHGEHGVGFAETAGSCFPRSILEAFPNARFVVIWRDKEEVARSIDRLGRPGTRVALYAHDVLQEAVAYLSRHARVFEMSYSALDTIDGLRRLWEFTRGEGFCEDRAREMRSLRVTKINPFAGTAANELFLHEQRLEKIEKSAVS